MSLWRYLICGLALLGVAVDTPGARAEALCPAVTEMADALRSATEVLPGLPGAARCQRILTTSGARTAYCRWDYGYRAEQATVQFEAARRALATCLAPDAEISQDVDVNHPDSYGMWTYRAEKATTKVSIKDKAADRKTHVFVWVEVPAP